MSHEDIETYAFAATGAIQGFARYYVAPELKKGLERLSVPHSGAYGWVGLGLGVATYDYLAMRDDKETLSHAFHRGLEHPIWKYMCVGLLGATALHLTKTVPRQLDIFYGSKHGRHL